MYMNACVCVTMVCDDVSNMTCRPLLYNNIFNNNNNNM